MKKKTILLVEDSEVDREILTRALTKLGFEVKSVESGEDALRAVEESRPDLVLLDILLPGMPGTQLVTRLRAKFNSVELPIIMSTVLADSLSVLDSLRLGANDYLTKPMNLEVAAMRISMHMRFAELSAEMMALREATAVQSVIATCHHELNNPLGAALGALRLIREQGDSDGEVLNVLEKSLQRMAKVVQLIERLGTHDKVAYEEYVRGSPMISLNPKRDPT